jgi:predicted RNase H-like HicB family nuclease
MKLKVVLESAEEGGYTVYIPALPGCISEGDTYEEALENIKDALKGYLIVLDRKTLD